MVLFTPQTVFDSQPVYTAQDIEAQKRAEYDRQMAAYRAEQDQIRAARAAANAQMDTQAQGLVDFLTANPLQWDDQSFIYGDLLRPSVSTPTGPQPSGTYRPSTLSSAGNIEGGSYVPTLDEARRLLDVSGRFAGNPASAGGWAGPTVQPRAGETPQDAVRRVYGGGLSDGLVGYLTSQMVKDQDGTLPAYVNGTSRNLFGDALSAAGFERYRADPTGHSGPGQMTSTIQTFAPQNIAPTPDMPAPWQPQAEAINQQNADNSRLYTDAYNKTTMGGNYGGGVINDNYSQPFANVVGGDVTMPWNTASWNTPSYGSPGAPEPTAAYGKPGGGLGGLGGGFGGPWGGKNPWSPA